ncbi:MAG: hypothetical protein ACLSG8_10040 [Barnesiella sp.]
MAYKALTFQAVYVNKPGSSTDSIVILTLGSIPLSSSSITGI